MNKIVFILILSLTFQIVNAQKNADIDRIFNTKFENNVISRGDNFPDFDINRDSINFLLFCLHENIPIHSFKSKTNFDDDKLNRMISFLVSKNWLHKVDSQYKPTIFIASENEGKALYGYASIITDDIVAAIKKSLPQIKGQFLETDASKSLLFEEWSFLILSNVLLDSWQIDNVETYFFEAR